MENLTQRQYENMARDRVFGFDEEYQQTDFKSTQEENDFMQVKARYGQKKYAHYISHPVDAEIDLYLTDKFHLADFVKSYEADPQAAGLRLWHQAKQRAERLAEDKAEEASHDERVNYLL